MELPDAVDAAARDVDAAADVDASEAGDAASPVADAAPPAEVPEGYVRIEPGRFTMGSPRNEEHRNVDEVQHQVSITRPFALKKTEVTQGEWRAVMDNNPSFFNFCVDCPVERVSWWDAVSYLNT